MDAAGVHRIRPRRLLRPDFPLAAPYASNSARWWHRGREGRARQALTRTGLDYALHLRRGVEIERTRYGFHDEPSHIAKDTRMQ